MTEMIENKQEHEIPISGENEGESSKKHGYPSEDSNEVKQNDENGSHKKCVERLQRLQAEFENYKKRVQKEKLELSAYIKSQLIYNLLPVIDDFDRMLNNTHTDNTEIITGTKLIHNKLMSILNEEGLEQISSVGKDFDPQVHEAILIVSGENDSDGKVLEELQKGYLFNDKLLRPSKVKVYKTKKQDSE